MRARLLFLALTVAVPGAEPVTNWVTTNGDAEFADGSEATNSPITTDCDAETIVGSFPEVTLSIGQTITLTGSIKITGRTGNIPGNQIRWALFDAPGTPTPQVGAGYVGIWATTANLLACDIRNANGSTGNPFSGTASQVIVSSDGQASMGYDISYDFSLSITRVDETQISVSGSLAESDGGLVLVSWPETTTAAFPDNFTYDCVGILLGGTTDATQAALSNVEVDFGADPAPDLVITSIISNPGDGTLTLTWSSAPGVVYGLDASTDLVDWPLEIDDNIPAAEESGETSFTIPAGPLAGNERLFFRIRQLSR